MHSPRKSLPRCGDDGPGCLQPRRRDPHCADGAKSKRAARLDLTSKVPGTWRSPPHRILLTRLRSFAPRAAAAGAPQARPGICSLAVATWGHEANAQASSQSAASRWGRGLGPPRKSRAGPTADRRRSELFTTGSYRRSDMPRECLGPSAERERPIEKSPLRAAVWDRRIETRIENPAYAAARSLPAAA